MQSSVEQSERITIRATGKDLLDLNVINEKKRGLALVEHRDFGGVPEEGMGLLRTVMVAHLIAPFFPKIIETNFGVSDSVFINELYKFYGYKPPRLETFDEINPIGSTQSSKETKIIEIANAHSGGLDSAFRMAKLMQGGKSVMGIHLRNLNNKGNFAEYMASKQQCEEWGVPFENVKLRNSSMNNGFDTMRTRDFLLAIVAAVTAYQSGSSKVLIEGDMFDDPEKGHFSENTDAWIMFNKLIKDANLKLEVEGVDPGDVETVGEVIRLEKSLGIEILPLIQNCFSAVFQRPGIRRKWERVTPIIAANSSREHWCGSCVKCRRMTMGRIIYQDPRFADVPRSEVEYFVKDTYSWLKLYKHNGDMVSASFLKHLASLC
ncbi:MAG TPA: hypothetical protein PLI45_00445 [Candidatus Woesebacteria bacterium]|nr:hypothetical protein [Candidatus Woesebacteria bacterium]